MAPSRQRTPVAVEPLGHGPRSSPPSRVPPSRVGTPAAFEPLSEEPESALGTQTPSSRRALEAIVGPVPLQGALGSTSSDMRLSHHVGRFALLRRVGRGSMGIVFSAYDDILDRKVAIKLLPPHVAQSPRARKRMLREAQALAKLRHPNVVQVYDAGIEAGRLFIAMEFVSGVTLRQWAVAVDEPRPWPEVLDVYEQAGQGLAAAHRAGLVHRDFKPDNAMLGRDDIVRVMDFGLARTGVTPSEEQERNRLEGIDPNATDASTMDGTPAYMAPEQWGKGTIDARTDQFSFCAALFEALWGTHPFEAPTIAMRAAAVVEGRIHDDLPSRGVPERIRRVVLRGLATDPGDRWPTMDALLEALSSQRRSFGRRNGWAIAVAGIAVVATAAAASQWTSSDAPAAAPPCQGLESIIAEVWNPARSQAVYDALAGLGPSYASDTAQRTIAAADRYAAALTDARRDACEAHRVRDEQPEPVMHQRVSCLDRRQRYLDAQFDMLARADAALLSSALELVHSLPAIETCSDLTYVAYELPPPSDPDLRAEIEAIARELVEIKLLGRVGQYEEAERRSEQALARARATGHVPTLIDALNRRAATSARLAKVDAGLAFVNEAYVLSDRGSRPGAVHTSTERGALLRELGRHEEALVELRRALSLQREISDRPTSEEGDILNELGMTLTGAGRHDEALVELEHARSIWLETSSATETTFATALGNIAVVHLELGRHEQAISELQEVIEIRLEGIGPLHPRMAGTYNNLAAALARTGRLSQSAEQYREALAILTANDGDHASLLQARVRDNLGNTLLRIDRLEDALIEVDRAHALFEEYPDVDPLLVAINLNNRGVVLRRLDRIPEALADHRRALQIATEARGADHRRVARMRDELGITLQHSGRPEEARREHEAAQAVYDRIGYERHHPARARTHHGTGRAMLLQGQAEAAREQLQRALEIHHAAPRPNPQTHSQTLGDLALALLALGDHDAALEHARQALTISTRGNAPGSAKAAAQFTLARVSWEIAAERPHAAPHVAEAREYFERVGDRLRLREVDRWRAAHPS